MTQGISQSLNLALARVNYIEHSFAQLEGIAQNSASQINTIESDFKKILDKKIEETDTIEKIATPEEKTEVSAEIAPEVKESIDLKSKIDLKAQNNDIEELIATFSEKYGVDSDFIKAIIKQESGFNAKATSKKGAMGLMQLMPKTAESLGVLDAYNPSQNIEGGVKYLKGLLDKFDNNHELALAAYNAGPTAFKKYGGIPPYKETQNYVKAIMGTYNKVKEAGLL